MSLHKVNSVASYEQIRRSSPARSKQGHLSFNPVESWIGPGLMPKAVIALEVSKSKRICTVQKSISTGTRTLDILTLLAVQVAVAVFYCFFSSGIIFGYAAIKPVLIKEGAYSDYCTPKAPASRLHTCYEQEIRYCNVFIVVVGLRKY